jgi:hypothetical protein
LNIANVIRSEVANLGQNAMSNISTPANVANFREVWPGGCP